MCSDDKAEGVWLLSYSLVKNNNNWRRTVCTMSKLGGRCITEMNKKNDSFVHSTSPTTTFPLLCFGRTLCHRRQCSILESHSFLATAPLHFLTYLNTRVICYIYSTISTAIGIKLRVWLCFPRCIIIIQ